MRERDFGFGAWAACCGPGYRVQRGRRGRRRRRMFGRGDLKYVVLSLLTEKPMHGYEVMQRLEEESGGLYSASPGSVYPVLQMLWDQGYLSAESTEGKRVYRLTEEGRRFLEEHRERAADVFDRVADFGDRFAGRDMRALTGAFVHLAQVSFEHAVRAAGDAEAVAAIREVLERAARELESDWRAAGRAEPEV